MSARNFKVVRKVQSALKSPASGSGAEIFRYANGAQGFTIGRESIRSNESRTDLQRPLGRDGSESVTGSLPFDFSLRGYNQELEDLLCGTWSSPVEITQTQMTSITTTTSTIVAAGGSWITQGVRAGDIVVLTDHSQAANNGKNLRVLFVTATTITVPTGSLVAEATPDATFTLTIPPKLLCGTTERYFTWVEIDEKLNAAKLLEDVRCGSLQMELQPNGMVRGTFGFVGRKGSVLENYSGTPHFTSPTQTSHLGLISVDSTIRLGNADLAVLTNFNLSFRRELTTVPVAGSRYSPDVYNDELIVDGTVSAIRSDMEMLKSYLAEEHLSLNLLLVDQNPTEPRGFLAMKLPLIKFGTPTGDFGKAGPYVQSIPIEAGIPLSGTGIDLSTAVFQTSHNS